MKGVIQEDHIALNRFKLTVPGLPAFVFTTLSGLEEELNTVDLPDRTVAPGGRTNPIELTVTLPLHHVVEQDAMETWFQDSHVPTQPGFKKDTTLTVSSISDGIERSFMFTNMFPSKRSISDFDMGNDGEMATVEWTLKADDMLKT